jgi:hypothetical protein
MIHGTDERESFKGYNVPRPHHALGDRPPLPEAIRGGQVSRERASGPLTAPTRVSKTPATQ